MPEFNYDDLREDRKKGFAVMVGEVHGGSLYPEGEEFNLSVTHNGDQWTSISLTKSEAHKVIKALNDWL